MFIGCRNTQVSVCADQDYHVSVKYKRMVPSQNDGYQLLEETLDKTFGKDDLFKINLRLANINVQEMDTFNRPTIKKSFQGLGSEPEIRYNTPN
mmetsp:Transcript_36020/g.55321  ORF Transcript_36020/g.55321 Transcript_36020/m.55321 type:complete len:94 (-) Transcript_36020:300-581(-)